MLLLGAGDDLDRVIVHTANTENVAVLAATTHEQPIEHASEELFAPVWTSQQQDIDEGAVRRSIEFLAEQERTPDSIVIRIDLEPRLQHKPLSIHSRRARKTASRSMLEALRAITTAAELMGGRAAIILVFQYRPTKPASLRWLYVLLEELDRNHRSHVRVNTIVFSDPTLATDVASAVVALTSHDFSGARGAFIPIDRDASFQQVLRD